jgi:hypothetical protein
MSRDSSRKAATVTARKATTPRTNAATVAAPVATDAAATPVITLGFGSAGRPSASDVAARDEAATMLREAIRALMAPAPAVAPRNASPRVRAAFAADNAAVAAAFALIRSARIR